MAATCTAPTWLGAARQRHGGVSAGEIRAEIMRTRDLSKKVAKNVSMNMASEPPVRRSGKQLQDGVRCAAAASKPGMINPNN
ncbi:MAG: hypothetical protein WCA22_07465 [Candidatus Binatus sp.]